jgi:hypothetical protein
MKYYSKEEICNIFTKFTRVNFDSGQAAATHYGKLSGKGMHRNYISDIKRHVVYPNKHMLADIGFEKVKEPLFIKVKGVK